MSDRLVCWRCGASVEEHPLPLARSAECRACHADLHVCRLCLYYDTSKARHCAEPIAEEVQDKQRANFCGYFTPRHDAFQPAAQTAAEQAKAQLAALFGLSSAQPETPTSSDGARSALDALFGSAKKPPED